MHQLQSSLPSGKPLITLNEARKLLGKSSTGITNDELIEMINDIESVVTTAIECLLRSKNDNIGTEL